MIALTRRAALEVLAAGAAAAVAPVAEARQRPAAPDDLGLLFDETRCIGCRACTVKCREANGLAPEATVIDGAPYDAPLDLDARTPTIIKRFQDGPRDGFVKAQCMHCVDPACVSVCMLGALHKEPRGVVGYDVSRCVGCRYCQVACPFNVPRFQWSSAAPRIVKCELCRHRYAEGKGAACAEVCPRDAIRFGPRAALLSEARRRLAAHAEAYHPGIYGEREGGGTGVLVLSAVPFGVLGLPALGPEPVPALGERVQHAVYQGLAAPVLLLGALVVTIWRNRRKHGAAAHDDSAAAHDEEDAP